MAREMRVVPYDPRWPALYESEAAVLRGVFAGLAPDIHHFGSTAVVGMAAKPTLDIMVVVEAIEAVDAFDEGMRAQGYIPRGENGIAGRQYFVRLAEDGENHAVHVHAYGKDNPHVADELMFRDYLRLDAEAFRAYKAVKRAAAQRYRYAPGPYEDAKHACVMDILAKAKAYFGE